MKGWQQDYTMFLLVGESGGRINVFIWGNIQKSREAEGQGNGHLSKGNESGPPIYYNQIDALEVK